jgi:hypothetical protein
MRIRHLLEDGQVKQIGKPVITHVSPRGNTGLICCGCSPTS